MHDSHPNFALIQEFFRAFIDKDIPKITEILDEGISWHVPAKHPLEGTKNGIDQVLDYLDMINKLAFRTKLVLIGISDRHIIACCPYWNNHPNGKNLENMSCLLWVIEDDKIKEVFNFPDEHLQKKTFFQELF